MWEVIFTEVAIHSTLTATTLTLSVAKWIPDAFIGGTLNPNTGQTVVYTITGNDATTVTVQLDSKPPMTNVALNGDPFRITVEGLPLNQFERIGRTVEFTLDINEDGESVGQDNRSENDDFAFTMRVGGIIRYLPPKGYDALKAAISDRTALGTKNDGDGVPEPGS